MFINSVSNEEILAYFNIYFTNQLTDFSAILYVLSSMRY